MDVGKTADLNSFQTRLHNQLTQEIRRPTPLYGTNVDSPFLPNYGFDKVANEQDAGVFEKHKFL